MRMANYKKKLKILNFMILWCVWRVVVTELIEYVLIYFEIME